MEKLKSMKENLVNCVQSQLYDLQNTDTEELGEAIDMIKDLAEAIYYCSITEAMDESKKEKHHEPMYASPMYYDGGNNRRSGGRMYYEDERYPAYLPPHDTHDYLMNKMDRSYPTEIRDYREGKSPATRRMYMESKELHHGEEKQRQELEKYMNELTQDIMEMIDDTNPADKAMLAQKLRTLADKIK